MEPFGEIERDVYGDINDTNIVPPCEHASLFLNLDLLT